MSRHLARHVAVLAALRRAALVGGSLTPAAMPAQPSDPPPAPAAPFVFPARQELDLSAAEWRAEADSLYAVVRRLHRNLYHHTPRAPFEARLAAVKAEFPDGAPADEHGAYQVVLRLKQLVALAGDGHTFLVEPSSYRRLPLGFFDFDDGVRVERADSAHRELLGMRLVAVGGRPWTAVRDSLLTIASASESTVNRRKDVAAQLADPQHLAAFGFAPSADSVRLTLTDGRRTVARWVRSVPRGAPIAWVWAYRPLPLFLSRPDAPIWHRPLGAATYYVNFQAYPDWPAMRAVSGAIGAALAARPGLRRVAIDMRLNGGGNFDKGLTVLLPVLQAARRREPRLRFYVLTGRGTFSAGMANAVHFRDSLQATVVGEPTGAVPNGYQENGWAALPRSRVVVSVATRYYRFQARDADGVQPDVWIGPSYAALRAGRDPTLAWVLRQPARSSVLGRRQLRRDGE